MGTERVVLFAAGSARSASLDEGDFTGSLIRGMPHNSRSVDQDYTITISKTFFTTDGL